MNKVILLGNLTQDPEVRYTQSGIAVASFRIAVNTGYGDNKRTDFIPIVAWRKLAEVCGNNLTKGSRVLVDGSLNVRSYDTQEGQKRYVTEVIAQTIEFVGSKPASAQTGHGNAGNDASSFGTEVFPEEEIPF